MEAPIPTRTCAVIVFLPAVIGIGFVCCRVLPPFPAAIALMGLIRLHAGAPRLEDAC